MLFFWVKLLPDSATLSRASALAVVRGARKAPPERSGLCGRSRLSLGADENRAPRRGREPAAACGGGGAPSAARSSVPAPRSSPRQHRASSTPPIPLPTPSPCPRRHRGGGPGGIESPRRMLPDSRTLRFHPQILWKTRKEDQAMGPVAGVQQGTAAEPSRAGTRLACAIRAPSLPGRSRVNHARLAPAVPFVGRHLGKAGTRANELVTTGGPLRRSGARPATHAEVDGAAGDRRRGIRAEGVGAGGRVGRSARREARPVVRGGGGRRPTSEWIAGLGLPARRAQAGVLAACYSVSPSRGAPRTSLGCRNGFPEKRRMLALSTRRSAMATA
jgi:hypothetical protein